MSSMMSSTMSSSSDMTANKPKRRRLNENSLLESEMTNYSVECNGSQPLLVTTQTFNALESQTLSQCPKGYPSSGSQILSDVSQVVTPELPNVSQFLKDDKYKERCRVCNRPAMTLNAPNKQCIQCDGCRHRYHLDCVDLSQRIYELVKHSKTVQWICLFCLELPERRPLLTIT